MEGRRQGGDQRRLGLMLYRCEDVIMRPSVFYTWKLKKNESCRSSLPQESMV